MTNFDMSRYDVKSIANSNLPIGGFATKTKDSSLDSSLSENKSPDGSRSADRDNLSSQSSVVTFASSQPSTSNFSFAIPIIKQDPCSDYWSNILKNTCSVTTNTLPYNSTTTPFNLDLHSNNNNNDNNNAFVDGGFFVQNIQHQSGSNSCSVGSGSVSSSSSIPLATPIALNSTSSYEGSSGSGNWRVGPTLHTFQTHAKTSLFQTPLFGLE